MTVSVLIMNDNQVLREGLSSVIDAQEGLHVVSAGPSTYNVRELVQKLQPEILLLDMQVLGSIYQIANDSKEARAGLKIVLTSSLTLPEQQSHAERIGAKGFISSLAAPVTIVNAIKAVSEGSVVFPQGREHFSAIQKLRDGVNSRTDHPLSPREVDVLCCVAQAMTAKEIARDLHISVKTVDRHKANIMNKLSMRSQIELARYAIRNGFVEA